YGSTTLQTDVEIGRLGTTLYSDGHLAFTIIANQSGNYNLKQYTYMYGGAYSVLVQTIPLQNPSRTMAPTSYGSNVLGLYKSENQGLYKVNELQPSTNPKQVSGSISKQVPLVAVWEPSELENEVMPSYIGSLAVGKKIIQSQSQSDSISTMAISDWFDWQGEVLSLNFYAPKGNPMHY